MGILKRMKALAMGVIAAATLTFGAVGMASAAEAVNVDANGLALKGHDPVAYFTEGKPVRGKSANSFTWSGATYHFATPANRDIFSKEPAKYAPQYGGHCALGTALGKKLPGDPNVWKIVDGKLYLNVNSEIQQKWVQDIPGHIAKADKTWETIKEKPAAEIN